MTNNNNDVQTNVVNPLITNVIDYLVQHTTVRYNLSSARSTKAYLIGCFPSQPNYEDVEQRRVGANPDFCLPHFFFVSVHRT